MNRFRTRVGGYIRTEQEIRDTFPGILPVVISADVCELLGVDPILQSPMPDAGTAHTVAYNGVKQDALGNWVDDWVLVPLAPEVIAANEAARVEALMKSIVDSTQDRLDAFAATRGYDSMLSACTYVTSTVPRLHAEGARCVALRDATWETLFTNMNAVKAGTAPMTKSFADIEPLLPHLSWED